MSATRTGGVFKSDNNGTTFTPVFETYGSASIGDIAIHPTNPDVVYVGTGEPNNRQTSSFGDGIYKTDRRRQDVHERRTEGDANDRAHRDRPEQSGRRLRRRRRAICSDRTPTAASTRRPTGARRWNKIKYIDENTGFTDIAMDPSNPRRAVRRELSAPSQRMLLQRRRSRAARCGSRTTPGQSWDA